MASLPHRRARVAAAALIAVAVAFLPSTDARTEAPPLASAQQGKGEPTLVLIHGLGVDRKVWDRVAPLLAREHRLLLVDLPGYGQTPLEGEPSVAASAAALDRTLKQLKINRPILVGHSYGALVALQEAVSHPNRARGIVAIDITTYLPADSARVASLDQLMTQRYQLFLQGVFSSMTIQPDLADTVLAWASEVPQPVLSAYFRDAWRTDLRGEVRDLKVPILVIATEKMWPDDVPWASEQTRMGYQTAGSVNGRRIYESGHLVPLDQPDTLAAAIDGFAAGLGK
jgi:pimeloyl-ACP methyl ester carboxylesterase